MATEEVNHRIKEKNTDRRKENGGLKMNDSNSVPLIRLEVERMKFQIISALTRYADQLNQQIEQAVEVFCVEDNINKIIQDAVNDAIKTVLNDEISLYFRYGEGRKIVFDAITKAEWSSTLAGPCLKRRKK